jgi:tetratricopeptide (TPR) repeat protein
MKHYKRALSILEQEPASVELARVVSSISQMHMLAYEFDEAAKWGERALALAERLGSEDVQVHTLNNLGVSYISRGSVDRGLAMLQRSLQQALDLKLPHDACRAYTNTAVMLMNLGRYEEPRALYEESVDYATQVHAHAFLAIAFARLIELDWVTGHWDIALSRWRQALDAISEVGRANVAGIYINTCYGWVYNDMGQAKVARSVLEEGLSHVRSKGEFQTTVPYLGQLARAYAALGLESQTAEVVAEILDVAEHAPYVHRYNTVSSFLFACRWLARRTTAESLDAARAHLHQSGRAYEEFGSPDAEAVLAEGKGSIASAEGDLARAAEQLEHAAALWDSLGRPYDQLRALVSLASAHRQMGNPDAARVACDAAQRLAEMLAAQIEDPELKTSFLNSELVQELRDIGKATARNPY